VTARSWARVALAAGAATLVLTGVMSIWNPRATCGPASATPPIIAFELATNASDLHAIFGEPGACRDALVADFRTVDRLDYGFLVAYGAFLYAALRALARGRSTAATLGLVAALVAPLADATENVALLAIDPDAPARWLPVLAIATRVKFALLGVWAAAFGAVLSRSEAGRLRLLAVLPALAAPVIVAALATPSLAPALVPAVTASWLGALVWCIARSRG
jgi:hypothetical protein